MKFWEDKGKKHALTKTTWDLAAGDKLPAKVFVEGTSVSGQLRDVEIDFETKGILGKCSDKALATVEKVDLDVDSDNSRAIFAGPDGDDTEDEIENDDKPKEHPGKYLPVNDKYPKSSPPLTAMKLQIDGLKRSDVEFRFNYDKKLKLWKDSSKKVVLRAGTAYAGDDVPESIYVEAFPGSEKLLAPTISVEYKTPSKIWMVGV